MDKTMKQLVQSLQGINFGRVLENNRAFTLGGFKNSKPFISIDYNKITNATISKQQDLLIQTAEQPVAQNDQMTEIRFFVDETLNENSNKEGEVTYSQQCLRTILDRSKAKQKAGEAITKLQQVNFVVPRGKYSITFYPRHLGLHGTTFSHKILFKDISRGFILPLNTQAQIAIVLALQRPVTLGQTLHKFLVMQIPKDAKQKKIAINFDSLRNSQNEQNETQLKKNYSGEQFQIIVDLLHAIAKISLIQPGQHFQSSTGHASIKASIKGQSGFLFLLKKSMIFIPRLVFYVKLQDIEEVNFLRLKLNGSQFDLRIKVKFQEKDIELMGIDKKQLSPLQQYFKEKSVKFELEQQFRKIADENEQSENQQEDEDFKEDEVVSQSSESSSSEDEIGSQEQELNQSSSKNKKVKTENPSSSENRTKNKKQGKRKPKEESG